MSHRWQVLDSKDLDTMFKLGTLPDAAAFQTALDEREHDKADLLDKLKI